MSILSVTDGQYGLRRRSRRIGCHGYHRCTSWWVYTARFWSGRSLSNHHMARRQGCLWVEPLSCGLHVYAGEPRLLHLRTAWLFPGIVTSSSSGLVSRCWEWMAASSTFSCSPWGNLYKAHTDGQTYRQTDNILMPITDHHAGSTIGFALVRMIKKTYATVWQLFD